MLAFDAHTIFGDQQLTGRVAHWPDELRDSWFGPAMMTAYAVLSGWLDDAQDENDADEAAAHGLSLVDAGVVTVEDLAAATDDAFDDMLRWGQQVEAELSRRAAAN